jgi:hypothetical protein
VNLPRETIAEFIQVFDNQQFYRKEKIEFHQIDWYYFGYIMGSPNRWNFRVILWTFRSGSNREVGWQFVIFLAICLISGLPRGSEKSGQSIQTSRQTLYSKKFQRRRTPLQENAASLTRVFQLARS